MGLWEKKVSQHCNILNYKGNILEYHLDLD